MKDMKHPNLDFEDLYSEKDHFNLLFLQDQKIEIRGFWYPLSHEEGILSSQPGLKSCCLKAPAKIEEQILVKGTIAFLSAQRAITLEGIFKIEPRYNAEGELIQLFVLEQAREISHPSSLPIGIMILGILVLLFCVWRFFFKCRNFPFPHKRN